MTLLFVVTWSRVWAAVPQNVAHDGDFDHGVSGHFETVKHLISLASDSNHVHAIEHVHGDEHSDESEHAGNANEHHHHLHFSSGGGIALLCELRLDLHAPRPTLIAEPSDSDVIQRPERLLRPPKA